MVIPKSPGNLDKNGRQFYKDVITYLIRNNRFNEIDKILVYQAAVWWQVYCESVQRMAREGTVLTTKNNYETPSVSVQNLYKSQTMLNPLLARLGIGVEARGKMKVTEADQEDDPMKQL